MICSVKARGENIQKGLEMKNFSQLAQGLEKTWATLPYNVDKVKDKYLVVSALGGWDFLNRSEYEQLSAFRLKKETRLYCRLKEKGLVIEDDTSLDRLIDDYRCANLNLFTGPGLHIIVLTNRCNLGCLYCQTSGKRQYDMDKDTASKILELVFASHNPNVTIEFQGGEPLLNWDVLRFFVDYSRRYNMTGRRVNLSLVSNFTLLDDEKIKFLIDNDVNLCTSLDGPRKIHDKNRNLLSGGSTYDKVVYWLNKIKKEYKRKRIKNKVIGALTTITKYSLPYYREIIDAYIKLGFFSIPLRSINKIGIARKNWDKIGYAPEEFIDFWKKGLDYILELNKKGIFIYERMAFIMLKKILKKEDPGYVDLCSPCGAGRSVLAYSPDGNVYTCDEARMLEEDLFKLGNVLRNSSEEILESPVLMQTCQASISNFWNYASAYSVFEGVCPVLNYSEQGSPVSSITQNSFYKIQRAQFEYLFEKLSENKDALAIFKRWMN